MADIEAKTEVTGAVWKIVTEVGQTVEAGRHHHDHRVHEDGDPGDRRGWRDDPEVPGRREDAVSEGQVVALLTS